MTVPSLEVVGGKLVGTTIPLGDEPFTIGRAEGELGRLGDDPDLSVLHAQIRQRDGHFMIEDLGSRNGTFVNGQRIAEPTQLQAGDAIQVGTSTLKVLSPFRSESARGVSAESSGATQREPGERKVVLNITAGPGAGKRIPLKGQAFVLGRSESGPGNLDDDPELSRRHARIFLLSGGLAVEDLESTNGTFVNGRRIVYGTMIGAGDTIKVGASVLEVADSPARSSSKVSRVAVSAVHQIRDAETGLLGRFALLASRRPKQILAAAAVFFVLSIGLGAPVVGILSGYPKPDPDVESSEAKSALEEASGTQMNVGLIALVRAGSPVESNATREKVRRVGRTIEREPLVAQVSDFYATRSDTFVSRDRRSTYVAAVFKDAEETEVSDRAQDLQKELEKIPGVRVGGAALIGPTVGDTVAEDLAKAEQLAFPILFLVSLFVFRGLVAAMLPMLVGVITIFGTFLALRMINTVTEISVFALNMVIALGLGLSIDYSLFIVSRYREEVARVGYGPEAIRRTLQTAGRTIIFSALTVMAALGSLLVFPQSFIYSMGFGGAACALVAVTVSVVVLPSLLALLGPRVDALSPSAWRRRTTRKAEGERPSFWYRLSRFVMRRPVPVAAASAVFLIALGLPFLRIEFTGIDVNVLPKDTTVREVDTALDREFSSNRDRQITVAIQAPGTDSREVRRYAADLRELPNVSRVATPSRVGAELWRVTAEPRASDLDERTLDLVGEIRDRPAPFPVAVAGPTAAFIDEKDSIVDHLPLGLALLVLVTATIMFVLTGSVILPVKSLLMNLLTVSAALGILVLIFQDGRFEGLLGFESQGGIELSQPLLLFAVVFGLSTDYAVFLLTRIKEARDSGFSEEEAVAVGLERTGRIITAAALLFCIAIGAFATSQIIFAKQLGIGTAFAVIIDATIVRALLVPSLMALLGRRNWWAPRPLRRLHDRVGLSES